MAAPDGSVMVPDKPDVPADCARSDGMHIPNNKVNSATKVSRERSSDADFISPSPFQL
jgi:hypothetical protein